MKNQIDEARKQGYSDDEIMNFIHNQYDSLKNPIQEATKENYSSKEILDFISNTYPQEPVRKKQIQQLRQTPVQPEIEQSQEQAQKGRGFLGSVKRGFGEGVTGLGLGMEKTLTPQDEGWIEHFGRLLGETASDLPGMFAGAGVGGAAGSAIAPGIGSAVGAGAGAFSLPTLIKSAYQEFEKSADKDMTFGDYLESIGNVAKETGKSAIVGGTVSQAARLLPFLKKAPGFQRLLNSRAGKYVEQPVAELTALTGAQSLVNQELPSVESIIDNSALILGFKLSRSAAEKVRNLAERTGRSVEDILSEQQGESKDSLEKNLQEQRKKNQEEVQRQKEPQTSKPSEEIETEQQSQEAESEQVSQETREEPKDDLGNDQQKSQQGHPNQESDTRSFLDKVREILPESVSEKLNDLSNTFKEKKQKFDREKKYFDLLEEYVGNKRAEWIESSVKWRKAFEEPVEIDGNKRNFTSQELQDMLYYRQKTGNPRIEGDTYNQLEKRLPKAAKDLVDNVIDKHFNQWLERWNNNPATSRKINPRESIKEIYLPGFWKEKGVSYEQAQQRAAEIMSKNPDPNIRKQFTQNGPFVNGKVYRTWYDAIKESGLEPRYDNIRDLMKGYDEMMIRIEANNELLSKIRDFEANNGEKLIVRSNNREAYQQARRDGWIPFDDLFLRRYVKSKDSSGKPIFSETAAPALVHPDAAPAFQGVFRKNAFRPENPFWEKYDQLGNFLKTSRVSLSPFHYVALAESGVGAMGKDFFKGIKPLRRFFSDNWWDNASKQFKDIDGLKHRARQGLEFKIPDEESYREGARRIEKILDKIPKNLKGEKLEKAINSISDSFLRYQRFLFNQYHPRLKVAAYDYYVDKAKQEYIKEDKPLTDKAIDEIEKSAAKVVNNQFGGQVWEQMRFFNNPENMKWVRRVVGYPDWTFSAARQAADAFAGGVKGDMARRYWIKYVIGWLLATSIGRFLLGGFKNDEETGSPTWDRRKALKSVNEKDPSKWISFPLPDVDVEIAGVKFNPGRDEKGKKLYAHFGKQALEIGKYATNTIEELFAKSNPIIQELFKQAASGTPYEGEIFPARGKYSAGEFKPWDATRPGTLARGISRAKEALGVVIPFSLRGLSDRGIATTIASGLGAVPVAKGLSLRKAEPYIYDALVEKNIKKLNQIVNTLKDNKYTETQIRNAIQRIRKEWLPNEYLLKVREKEKNKQD